MNNVKPVSIYIRKDKVMDYIDITHMLKLELCLILIFQQYYYLGVQDENMQNHL